MIIHVVYNTDIYIILLYDSNIAFQRQIYDISLINDKLFDLEAIRNELVSLCSIKASLEIGTSSKINMGYVPPIARRFPEVRKATRLGIISTALGNHRGNQVAASSDNRKQAKGRRALPTIWRIETLPASTLDKRLDSGSSS